MGGWETKNEKFLSVALDGLYNNPDPSDSRGVLWSSFHLGIS